MNVNDGLVYSLFSTKCINVVEMNRRKRKPRSISPYFQVDSDICHGNPSVSTTIV